LTYIISKLYIYAYSIKINGKIYICTSSDINGLIHSLYEFDIFDCMEFLNDPDDPKLALYYLKDIIYFFDDILPKINNQDNIEIKTDETNIYFFNQSEKIITKLEQIYIYNFITQKRKLELLDDNIKKILKNYQHVSKIQEYPDIMNLDTFILMMLDRYAKIFKKKHNCVKIGVKKSTVKETLDSITYLDFDSDFNCKLYCNSLIHKYPNYQIYKFNMINDIIDPYKGLYIYLFLNRENKLYKTIIFTYTSFLDDLFFSNNSIE